MGQAPPIHVVHCMYRFAAGGLENVIVQLVNALPEDRFRHTIVSLTSVDPAFAARIRHPGVRFIALDKPPGQPFAMYGRFYRLLRQLQPDVFHSCNLAALEFAPVAAAAGVRRRVHAEHGWDVADPDGSNRRYQLLRKLYQPFVHRFVVVSEQLRDYLCEKVKVSPARVHFIANGVDTDRFRPMQAGDVLPADFPFSHPDHVVIGSVGRMEPVKNHELLVDAFIELTRREGPARDAWRLVIVGDGPLRERMQTKLRDLGLLDKVWMPGARGDVAEMLRAMSVFVLPSLAEGTSCTLQEAMATGLRIVATDVGGNGALLQGGKLGRLVPCGQPGLLADAISDQAAASDVQWAARDAVAEHYSLAAMVERYRQLFTGA